MGCRFIRFGSKVFLGAGKVVETKKTFGSRRKCNTSRTTSDVLNAQIKGEEKWDSQRVARQREDIVL